MDFFLTRNVRERNFLNMNNQDSSTLNKIKNQSLALKIISVTLIQTVMFSQLGLAQLVNPITHLEDPLAAPVVSSEEALMQDENPQAYNSNEGYETTLEFLEDSPLSSADNYADPIEFLLDQGINGTWDVSINNGSVSQVSQQGETLSDVRLSDAGEVSKATYDDENGDRWTIQNGEVVLINKADGSVEHYEDEYLVKKEFSNGDVKRYERKFDHLGNVNSLSVIHGDDFDMPDADNFYERYSDGSQAFEIGSNQNYTGMAQSVQFGTDMAVSSLEFWMRRTREPQGLMRAKIYTNQNGQLGELIAHSEERDVSELTLRTSSGHANAGWAELSFEEEITLEANQNYWLVFDTDLSTFGNGSNWIAGFRNEGDSGENYEQIGWIYPDGSMRHVGGILDVRINGYEGGVPGPERDKYDVDSAGFVLDENGVNSTLPTIPEKVGFTKKKTLTHSLENLVELYKELNNVSFQLTSAANVDYRDYQLTYEVEGQLFQQSMLLEVGDNSVPIRYTDSMGRVVQMEWSVFSDTFPPKVNLVSAEISNNSEYEIAYLVDGEIQRENVYLRAGRNTILRNFENEWGNTESEFVIDFQPMLEDGTILKYRNGIIVGAESQGIIFENIQLSDSGVLISGSVLLNNGERIEVNEGEVTGIYSPSGRIREYTNGFITKDLRASDLPLFFSRIFNDSNQVNQLTVQVGDEIPLPPKEVLYERYSEGSQAFEIGSNQNYTGMAQSVQFGTDMAVSSLEFWMRRTREPQGVMRAKIYTNQNGQLGELIAHSEERDVSELTLRTSSGHANAGWAELSFEEEITIEANQNYWFVFDTDLSTFGNGSNWIAGFRNEGDSGESYEQIGWIYPDGSMRHVGGMLDIRVNGYNGGIPGPEIINYQVNLSGELQDETGLTVSSAYVPYPEGYVSQTEVIVQSGHEGDDILPLLNNAIIFRNPPEPPVADLLSSSLTNEESYTLRYEVNGHLFEETYTLQEGDNRVQFYVQDELGQMTSAEFWITLDTTPPEIELISQGETNFSDYTLRYLSDGRVIEETLQLSSGENQIVRESRDAAGNVSIKTFLISYHPFFQEQLSVYDAENHLLSIQDPMTGVEIFYSPSEPYDIQIKNSDGSVNEVLSFEILKKNLSESLVVTLENGLEALYQSGDLIGFRTEDGMELQDVVLDGEGNVETANIFYANGRVDFIRYGVILRTLDPQGNIRDFSLSQKPVRDIQNSEVSHYFYILNGDESLKEVKVEQPDGSILLYDDAGVLERIDNSNGAYSELSSGILTHLQTEEGKQFVYTQEQVVEDGEIFIKSELNLQQSDAPLDKTPVETFYHLSGQLAKVKLWDGSEVQFSEGLPNDIVDSNGNRTTLSYLENQGLLSGLILNQNGTQFKYNEKGSLSAIESFSGTLEIDGDEVSRVFLPDGTVIENLIQDSSTFEITDGVITSPDGTIRTFEGGVLTKIETVSGEVYETQSENQGFVSYLKELNFQDGTQALFNQGVLSQIQNQDLSLFTELQVGSDGRLGFAKETLQDGEEKFYEEGVLKYRVLDDGTRIDYEEGLAFQLITPENQIFEFKYQRNTQNEIIAFRLENENKVMSYGIAEDNQMVLQSVRNHNLVAFIENGVIQSVKSHFGRIENPVFDSSGNLVSGELIRIDGAQVSIENGVIQQTVLSNGDRIVYGEDRIDSIETEFGLIQLIYSEHGIEVEYDESGEIHRASMALFLLNPDRERERQIILSEPLINDLSQKRQTQVQFDTQSAIQLDLTVQDEERGEVYRFNSNYRPVWNNVVETDRQDGFIRRMESLTAWDSLPAIHSDFMDINGDGLPDRIFFDPEQPDRYDVQLNNGQGFDDLIQWGNVQTDLTGFFSQYGDRLAFGALSSFEGRHPHRLSEFMDINGDGLPDRVMMGYYGQEDWVVQFNNGQGFEDPQLWEGAFPLARIWSFQAFYASEVRNDEQNKEVQELMADMVDMNGDGLADRVLIAPREPYDYWLVQFNNGSGFDFPVVWDNVVNEFYYQEHDLDGSLSVTTEQKAALLSTLQDMNGDGRTDRVFNQWNDVSDPTLGMEWYVQINNGEGFDDSILWDDDVRLLDGVAEIDVASSIRYVENNRQVWVESMDINGDGLIDRITVDQTVSSENSPTFWWVELNNGSGFNEAVQWQGVENYGSETIGIRADNELWHSTLSTNNGIPLIQNELIDINGDSLVDRIIYQPGNEEWLVQFNNGNGFEPLRAMHMDSLIARSEGNGEDYEYLHVSLKQEDLMSSELETVIVTVGDAEFTLNNVGNEWKDFYLPLDSVTVSDTVTVNSLNSSNNEILVDNITWVNQRKVSASDWMTDLFITQNQIPSITQSVNLSLIPQSVNDRDELIVQKDLSLVHESEILKARTVLRYSDEGKATQVETADGRVAEISNGNITQIRHQDGSILELSYDESGNLSEGANFNHFNETPDALVEYAYGRIREVSRENKPSLNYSYEFDALGREITVIEDPETGIKERYLDSLLMSTVKPNGIETVYQYDEHGKLTSSSLQYKGSVKQVFQHERVEDREVVIQSNGIREEYSEEGALLFHTLPNGLRYQHEYVYPDKVIDTVSLNAEGFEEHQVEIVQDTSKEKIHRVKLIEKAINPNAPKASYEEGVLTQLILEDDSQIFWEEIEGNQKALIVYPDGIEIEYENGVPKQLRSTTGLTKDFNSKSAVDALDFHYQEAVNAYQLIQSKQLEYQLDPETSVLGEFTLEGEPITEWKADNTVSLYDDNGLLEEVVDGEGNTQIQYEYDSEGNPAKITMVQTRAALEREISLINTDIEIKRAEALAVVAEREFIVHETIEGSYEANLERLIRERDRLLGQRNEVSSIEIPKRAGKEVKSQIADVLGSIDSQVATVEQMIFDLAETRSQALRDLDQNVATAYDDIQLEVDTANLQVLQDKEQIEHEILLQELTPIILHQFRTQLGRDPSQDEINYWISQVPGSLTKSEVPGTLATILLNSTERADRTLEVNSIKDSVRTLIETYLNGTEGDKENILSDLNLTSEEALSLTEGEAESILEYLDNQDLHFGQSAFLALEALLEDSVIASNDNGAWQSPDRVTLARDLIVMDILKGILTPLEEGDLVISLFSMKRYAERVLSSSPSSEGEDRGEGVHALNLNYESLRAMYQEACSEQGPDCEMSVIAHIDGNHYIELTQVTEEGIVYRNPGHGPEDNLEIVTLTKDEFLTDWEGVVLSTRAPPSENQNNEIRELTEIEQTQIRGAFFGITAIVLAGLVFGAISALANFAFSLISTGSFKQAFNSTVNLISSIASLDLISAVGIFKDNFFNGLDKIASGIGKVIPFLGKIGHKVIRGAKKVADTLYDNVLNTKVFRTVFDSIKIVGGIVAAPFSAGASLALVGNGVNGILSRHTDLNPTAISLISSGASLFSGFGLGGFDLSGSLDFLQSGTAKNILGDIAITGLDALGASSELTSLLSIPIRVTISGGIQGIANPSAGLFSSIKDALFNTQTAAGLVSVGANIGLNRAGAPLEVGGLVSGLLGQLLVNNASIPNADQTDANQLGSSLFQRITNTAQTLASKVINGAQNAISFGVEVLQKGFDKTVEFFGGLFSRETQEVLHEANSFTGASGWQKIGSLTDQNGFVTTIYSNNSGDTINVESVLGSNNITITKNIKGKISTEIYENVKRTSTGLFSIGNVAFAEQISEGTTLNYSYQNNELSQIQVQGDQGYNFLTIEPLNSGVVGVGGGSEIKDGKIYLLDKTIGLEIESGNWSGTTVENITTILNALNHGVSTQILNSPGVIGVVEPVFNQMLPVIYNQLDESAYDSIVGRKKHDFWTPEEVMFNVLELENFDVSSPEMHPEIYTVEQYLDVSNVEMQNQIRDTVGEDNWSIINTPRNREEFVRVLEKYPNSKFYLYSGNTSGLLEHMIHKEGITNSRDRNSLMLGGDHRPFTDLNGQDIVMRSIEGIALDVQETGYLMNGLKEFSSQVSQVRIGTGPHFHNILDNALFFHIDDYPNNSVNNIIGHQIEVRFAGGDA